MVEVRADDQVDVLRLEADCGEALEEGHVELVEETDGVGPAVTSAGIDQYDPAIDHEHPALKDQVESILLIQETRLQPVTIPFDQNLVLGEIADAVGNAQLLDPLYLDVADGQDPHFFRLLPRQVRPRRPPIRAW